MLRLGMIDDQLIEIIRKEKSGLHTTNDDLRRLGATKAPRYNVHDEKQREW